MATEIKTKWSLEADYLQGCNCDYGCPCEFQAPPTMGFCEGLGFWRIRNGRHGDVALDGLSFGFAAKWPKAIHEGNGTVQLYFDERATPPQRDALLKIASGQSGGIPFEIIVQTFSTVLEPLFVPFQWSLNGRDSSVTVGTSAAIAVEPIRNPVTQEPESVRIEHGSGFIFQSADCVSAKVCQSAEKSLPFSYPNKAGFVAQIRYAN